MKAQTGIRQVELPGVAAMATDGKTGGSIWSKSGATVLTQIPPATVGLGTHAGRYTNQSLGGTRSGGIRLRKRMEELNA